MEPKINMRGGLERLCAEAAKNLRHYNDFEVKLRQTRTKLEDEKVAREDAEKRITMMELVVEAASKNLKLERMCVQDAQEQILLRESQLQAFHSKVAEFAKAQPLQQDQLLTVLQTFEIGSSDNDHNKTNVRSIAISSSTTYPSPLHQHIQEHQSSKQLRRSTSQSATRSKLTGGDIVEPYS